MGKYTIVEFEDGLQLVPTIWITNNICSWPKCPVQIEINKAIEAAKAPQANWTTYRILKVFGSADSYVDGIRKLKLAEKFSDVDSNSDIETSKKKRQSRAKKIIYSDDDAEDQQPQRKSNILPPPPRPVTLIKNITVSKIAPSSENIEVPQWTQNALDVDEEEYSEVENTLSQSFEASVQRNTNIVKHVNKIETKADTDPHLPMILRKLNAISLKIDMVRDEVRSLKIDKENDPKEAGSEIDFDIPLRSMDQLEQMEREVENSEYYKNLVTFLKGIGKGNSINDATTMILKRLFINELAVKFTFGGHKKNKRCFKELCLHKIVLKVVRLHFNQSTEQEINKAIEKWLIQANLRLTREQAKQNDTIAE
ncbi:unnamed protein product [Brassicogethes aeneus]|uniref:DUF4806 domain-containing protein n=1 Tax=Brassicogethes aeneus TaxID=1431903 RepID=A0A9P0B863_BRAAE|nr:unnamed protein product [Brassicogethes aeneus]